MDYETPRVEVVNVVVEQGFAASDGAEMYDLVSTFNF